METSRRKFNPFLNFILVGLAGALLVVANSAFWFNRYIFNTDNFTQTVSEALNSESSRDAIGREVVEKAFADRPILRNTIGNTTVGIVSGLLGTDLAKTATNRTIERLHSIAVSKNPQNVEIDLTTLKGLISSVSNLVETSGLAPQGLSRVDTGQVPSKIVLVEASRIPNIYRIGNMFLWLGPISFIAALLLFLIPIWRNFANRASLSLLLLMQGVGMLIFGSISPALGPLFKPRFLAEIDSANLRVVAGNLYNSFVQKFDQQTQILFLLGLIFLLFAFLNWWFRVRGKSLA